MQKTPLKELTISLPGDILESVTVKEIVSLLMDKALSKAEYYRSRCREMEEKHHMKFALFKRKAESGKSEVFDAWDDLILWEGFERASAEWGKKYRELKRCTP